MTRLYAAEPPPRLHHALGDARLRGLLPPRAPRHCRSLLRHRARDHEYGAVARGAARAVHQRRREGRRVQPHRRLLRPLRPPDLRLAQPRKPSSTPLHNSRPSTVSDGLLACFQEDAIESLAPARKHAALAFLYRYCFVLKKRSCQPKLAVLPTTPVFPGQSLTVIAFFSAVRNEGLSNVHYEPAMVPHWDRGEESCTLMSPQVSSRPSFYTLAERFCPYWIRFGRFWPLFRHVWRMFGLIFRRNLRRSAAARASR